MPLKVACQMDPIDRIDIRGDSTFALLLEAQRRGHSLFYYTPAHLSLFAGRLVPMVRRWPSRIGSATTTASATPARKT